MRLDEQPVCADVASAALASTGANSRRAGGLVAAAAGLLHRMCGVEHNGETEGLLTTGIEAHVGDDEIVCSQDVVAAFR